jgi:hypothetical protein
MTELAPGALKRRNTHVWDRAENDFYPTNPPWVIERLLDVEVFLRETIDCCCGSGAIVVACRERHLPAEGWDIVDRGFPGTVVRDFLTYDGPGPENFITNPPFGTAQAIVERAVELARCKTAVLLPVARLNAARWLRRLPLARVWLLTPRPSMPPHSYLVAGRRPSGGSKDFCWAVFERDYPGSPSLRWLCRDGD